MGQEGEQEVKERASRLVILKLLAAHFGFAKNSSHCTPGVLNHYGIFYKVRVKSLNITSTIKLEVQFSQLDLCGVAKLQHHNHITRDVQKSWKIVVGHLRLEV